MKILVYCKTTLSYCLKSRKNTETKNVKVLKTKNGRIMLISKCEVCDGKKAKFIKEQEVSRLLTSLAIKTPLCKIHLVGPLFFYQHKMNKIVNKFLLAGDKFMPEMHLRQSGFKYSTVDHLQKTKKEYKNLKKQEIHDIFIKAN